jgi:hypothetical protein
MSTSAKPTLRDITNIVQAIIKETTTFQDPIGQVVASAAVAVLLKILKQLRTAETYMDRAEIRRQSIMFQYASSQKLDLDIRKETKITRLNGVRYDHPGKWIAVEKPNTHYFEVQGQVYKPSDVNCMFNGFEDLTCDISFTLGSHPWAVWSPPVRASFSSDFDAKAELFFRELYDRLKTQFYDLWYSLGSFQDHHAGLFKYLRTMCHAVAEGSISGAAGSFCAASCHH